MAELKTKPTTASVAAFLASIAEAEKRADAAALVKMMKRITGKTPKMWGSSIVGFGAHHYKYASGREGDWFLTGFSPRKQSLVLYVAGSFAPHKALLEKLGKHKTGVGCLYIKRLKDVDIEILGELITRSVQAVE